MILDGIRRSACVVMGCTTSEDKKVDEGPTGVFEIQCVHGDNQDLKSLSHVSRRLGQNVGHEGCWNNTEFLVIWVLVVFATAAAMSGTAAS